jgi:hypothetical protein
VNREHRRTFPKHSRTFKGELSALNGFPREAVLEMMRAQENLKRCFHLLIIILTTISCTIKATNDGSLAILTVFKNEGHRMNEFLLHYVKEGVTQFLLVDNDSTDLAAECIIGQFAKEYPDLEFKYVKFHESNQARAYNRYIGLSTREWTLIVDVDEFVFATEGHSSTINNQHGSRKAGRKRGLRREPLPHVRLSWS